MHRNRGVRRVLGRGECVVGVDVHLEKAGGGARQLSLEIRAEFGRSANLPEVFGVALHPDHPSVAVRQLRIIDPVTGLAAGLDHTAHGNR